jgi:hypothetical protein
VSNAIEQQQPRAEWGIRARVLDGRRHIQDEGMTANCGVELVLVPPPEWQHTIERWPACQECLRIECEKRGIPMPTRRVPVEPEGLMDGPIEGGS